MYGYIVKVSNGKITKRLMTRFNNDGVNESKTKGLLGLVDSFIASKKKSQ